jgi:hypothetical protein
MAKHQTRKSTKKPPIVLRPVHHAKRKTHAMWKRHFLHKIWISIVLFVFFVISVMYGIGQWYIFTQRNVPMELGVTFIPSYARYLDVEPQETFQAILKDLKPKHVRLVSYWDEIEKTPGIYDFTELDWQFAMADQAGTKVSLAIGLRQPRWPECHMPAWQLNQPKDIWYPQLKKVMTATIERYKTQAILESYQLENEFFLSVFGECPDFSRDRLIDEYNLVKSLDPHHTLVISRSNNAIGFPLNEPRPDKFGVSVYKRVWDKTLTKRYVEYPFPGWFYAFLAGGGKLITGKDLMIHELQAEAWTPDGYEIKTAPLEELNKSMNPERLSNRFDYAAASGMKRIDLWGVEWWYAMKVNRGEPELWNTARGQFEKYQENDPIPRR